MRLVLSILLLTDPYPPAIFIQYQIPFAIVQNAFVPNRKHNTTAILIAILPKNLLVWLSIDSNEVKILTVTFSIIIQTLFIVRLRISTSLGIPNNFWWLLPAGFPRSPFMTLVNKRRPSMVVMYTYIALIGLYFLVNSIFGQRVLLGIATELFLFF